MPAVRLRKRDREDRADEQERDEAFRVAREIPFKHDGCRLS
jgi:hypothetical protein